MQDESFLFLGSQMTETFRKSFLCYKVPVMSVRHQSMLVVRQSSVGFGNFRSVRMHARMWPRRICVHVLRIIPPRFSYNIHELIISSMQYPNRRPR